MIKRLLLISLLLCSCSSQDSATKYANEFCVSTVIMGFGTSVQVIRDKADSLQSAKDVTLKHTGIKENFSKMYVTEFTTEELDRKLFEYMQEVGKMQQRKSSYDEIKKYATSKITEIAKEIKIQMPEYYAFCKSMGDRVSKECGEDDPHDNKFQTCTKVIFEQNSKEIENRVNYAKKTFDEIKEAKNLDIKLRAAIKDNDQKRFSSLMGERVKNRQYTNTIFPEALYYAVKYNATNVLDTIEKFITQSPPMKGQIIKSFEDINSLKKVAKKNRSKAALNFLYKHEIVKK